MTSYTRPRLFDHVKVSRFIRAAADVLVFRRLQPAWFLVALACLMRPPAEAPAAYPSPADWRDETIYQIVTDRWDNGDTSNDTLNTTFNPAAGDRTHGGDFKGIKRRLGYLRGLGVTAIWISPIPLNAYGEYHGYAARDFTLVDPHWGTLADLQDLVATCHANGIRVILDVVCNHGGNLFNDNSYLAPPSTYSLTYRDSSRQHAAPFNSLSNWHAHGSIGSWTDPEQILGELSGLDDLKTEDSYVRSQLISIWSNWITSTDADGFRIDTVKHTELGFWQEWAPGVRANSGAFGKSNFFMFGEVFDGSDWKNGLYTGTKGGGAFALDSTLDYPLYFQTNDVFARASAGAQNIVNHYNAIPSNYDPAAQARLVTFLDNHDNVRFLSSGLASDRTARLHAALVFQLTSLGVPCVYYGTEQYFNGGGDPYDREDMFDGQFEFGPSLGNNFDQAGTAYRLMRRLNQFRRDYSALRRGTLTVREVRSSPGIFAYSRADGANEVLVVLNTSDSTQTGGAWQTGFASGTVLVDLLNPANTVTVNASLQVPAGTSIAGNSFRLFVPQASVTNFEPEVIAVNVTQGGALPSVTAPLAFTFSEPMNPASVDAAFSLAPLVAGTLAWDASNTILTFTPSGNWPASTATTARIAESATDQAGAPLRGGFEREFVTSSSGGGGGGGPADPSIDGTIAGDPRWAGAVATQAVQTGFGDNTLSAPDNNSGGSEANQLFVESTSAMVTVAVSGNLEPNGNVINLVFDTNGSAGGANTLNGTGATSTFLSSTPNSATGTRLPTGMTADIILQVQLNPPNQTLTLQAFTWNAAGTLASEDVVGIVAANPGNPTMGTVTGNINGVSWSLDVAYNNSHTGPVTAGSSAASPNGSGAQTGTEIAIPKALLGPGPYKLFAGISGPSGFWSNQFLPPINPATNRGWRPNLATAGLVPYSYMPVPVTLSGFRVD